MTSTYVTINPAPNCPVSLTRDAGSSRIIEDVLINQHESGLEEIIRNEYMEAGNERILMRQRQGHIHPDGYTCFVPEDCCTYETSHSLALAGDRPDYGTRINDSGPARNDLFDALDDVKAQLSMIHLRLIDLLDPAGRRLEREPWRPPFRALGAVARAVDELALGLKLLDNCP